MPPLTPLTPPSVLIRTSGAAHIGLGHLMRCLALAEAFAEAGWRVCLYGRIPDFVAPRWADFDQIAPNHPETDLMADWDDPAFLAALYRADWLVTDLYALGDEWRQRTTKPILALSDPPHWPRRARLTLMPTLFPGPGETYGPTVLTAPAHCLISQDLRRLRPAQPPTEEGIPRLVISCGGGEDLGLAALVMEALAETPLAGEIHGTVILGALQPTARERALRAAQALPGLAVREKVADMGAALQGHSVAFGTPAGAALERACLGMAQVLVPIVDNQHALSDGLARLGVAQVLPLGVAPAEMAQAVCALLTDAPRRHTLAARAWSVIDGQGAAAVVQALSRQS